ncbi:MAG: hypothetical protein LBT45_02155 [Rickettsiales bacterium]|jgi:hypothetical protein|nr:hypothetical protein [Rickettsiales bacterium]
MKKLLAAVFLALFAAPAFAASSTADLSSGPAKRENLKMEQFKQEAASRRIKSDANLYYVAKGKRDSSIYRDFAGCNSEGCEKNTRSVRAEEKKSENARKYNLNNPFFQPRRGELGSVTDLSYNYGALDIKVSPATTGNWAGQTGKYSAKELQLTENLSFGITDDITIIGSVRFNSTNLNIHWPNLAAPQDNDSQTKKKVDLWGAGLQWRVLNDNDWIANISGSYQNLIDSVSVFSIESKVGYKNDDTTIYGFGRVQYRDWNSEGYGIGIKNQFNQTVYFTMKEKASSSFYYEVGAGLFVAMNGDWSADLSASFADAEWHQQIAARASLSYQPWKNAALNVYGRIALWDNADGFKKSQIIYHHAVDNGGVPINIGTAAFENYSEMAAGLQLVLLF